jgi:hypothetical protein
MGNQTTREIDLTKNWVLTGGKSLPRMGKTVLVINNEQDHFLPPISPPHCMPK